MKTCPFTGYREVEEAAKNSELYSTKYGLAYFPRAAKLHQQLRARHVWPVLKNSGIILKAIWTNARRNHGRFAELCPAEAVRYRSPVSSFLAKRTNVDLEQINQTINYYFKLVREKNEICLCQDLVWPASEDLHRRMLGIPKNVWEKFQKPISNLFLGLDPDPISGYVGRIHGRYLFEKEVERQRASPEENGLINHLIALEKDGKKFSNTEIAGMVWMLVGGFLSIRYFLSQALDYFAKNPSVRKEFLEKPQIRTGIIEELLRFFSPGLPSQRVFLQDSAIGEKTYKKGDVATLSWIGANYDENMFEQPREIDFNRKQKKHLAFGAGPHYCIGAGMVRSFTEVFLVRFFEEFPNYQINTSLSVKANNPTFSGFDKLPAKVSLDRAFPGV